jgi:hypothetical protein
MLAEPGVDPLDEPREPDALVLVVREVATQAESAREVAPSTNAQVANPAAWRIPASVGTPSGTPNGANPSPYADGYRPVSSAPCDGNVDGPCATARSKRSPSAASASNTGLVGRP